MINDFDIIKYYEMQSYFRGLQIVNNTLVAFWKKKRSRQRRDLGEYGYRPVQAL